jgi:hypothetical protein
MDLAYQLFIHVSRDAWRESNGSVTWHDMAIYTGEIFAIKLNDILFI